MSTHNIDFYEDFTKIMLQLANIIKYTPYLFFCVFSDKTDGIHLPNQSKVAISNDHVIWCLGSGEHMDAMRLRDTWVP